MKRLACHAVTAAILLLAPASALAGDGAAATRGHITLSRHHTTNALDGPLAVSDWYTLLRGALAETLAHELGSTTLSGTFELRRYDRYAIEDDAAVSIAAQTTVRASDALELRGTLSLQLVEEGDDLPVGSFVIGTRARKIVAGVAVQAGLQPAPATTLVLEAAATRDMPGDARFQHDLLPRTRLEPARDRLRLAATLTRKDGPFSYGLFAGSGFMRAQPLGLVPRLDVFDHTARLHAQLALPEGPTVAAAAGLQMLALPAASFRQLRPTWEIVARAPLAGGLALRGSLKAAYDLASSDDPVAVWLQRLEVEASYRAGPALTLGMGLFSQKREFLGQGTGERGYGGYGEAVWQAHPRLAVTLRLDATRYMLAPHGIRRRGIDTHLAVRTNL